jgi:hypothetical protein
MSDIKITASTSTPVSSGAELAPTAINDINRFNEWVTNKYGGQPLTNPEKMILQDYLYWKVLVDRG